MNPLITTSDRVGNILKRPEFKDIQPFILPVPPGLMTFLFKQLRLSAIKKYMPTWNIDDMADGLNRILEIARSGSRFRYEIWNKSEKADTPGKKGTALFHFPVNRKAPFVLVCAGGAYAVVASLVEAFPVAAELNRMGYSAFVLHYRTGKNNPWPAQMEDLQQALHYILTLADEFRIEKENYAVAGFSAGGHLVSSLGTKNFGYKNWNLPKPGALFLGYPVTWFENMTKIHKSCLDNIMGSNPTKEQVDSLNVILNADANYPPTFLMHGQDDDAIYFENSEKLAQKLESLGIPSALRSVPTGGHGIGLGNGTQAEGWLSEAVQFWQGEKKPTNG